MTARLRQTKGRAALAVRHPLGIGPGQFDIREPISSHNTYVRVLSEQGVLGFAALAVCSARSRSRSSTRRPDAAPTASGRAALLAAWCGLLANSFFIDTLHWRHLWFVAGLIWAGAMLRYRSRKA